MATMPVHDLLSQALALPEDDRIKFAGTLLASVKPTAWAKGDDRQFESELACRQQQLRDGTAATFSDEETIAAMRQAVSERQPT